jgi:hypothetical protein
LCDLQYKYHAALWKLFNSYYLVGVVRRNCKAWLLRLEKHHGDLAEMSICNNSLPRTHVMSTAELLMQDLTTMWSISKPYQASHWALSRVV